MSGLPYKTGLRPTTIAGAAIGWFAVITQFALMMDNRIASVGETIVRFFSFFTILTNTIVTVCFTDLSINHSKRKFFTSPPVLTAISLYITIVGLVYQLVLRQIWQPEGLAMVVDEILHTIAPIYFIGFWLAYVPKRSLEWKLSIYWLAYPLAYLLYILIRGAFSGFYPYPFVDVAQLGFNKVLLNATGLMILFLVAGNLFIAIGKLTTKNNKH